MPFCPASTIAPPSAYQSDVDLEARLERGQQPQPELERHFASRCLALAAVVAAAAGLLMALHAAPSASVVQGTSLSAAPTVYSAPFVASDALSNQAPAKGHAAHAGRRVAAYLSSRGRTLQQSLPSPIKAVYITWRDINWADPAQTLTAAVDAGFSVVVLSFWRPSGAAEFASAWSTLAPAAQASAVAYAHSKGAVVLLRVGSPAGTRRLSCFPHW